MLLKDTDPGDRSRMLEADSTPLRVGEGVEVRFLGGEAVAWGETDLREREGEVEGGREKGKVGGWEYGGILYTGFVEELPTELVKFLELLKEV